MGRRSGGGLAAYIYSGQSTFALHRSFLLRSPDPRLVAFVLSPLPICTLFTLYSPFVDLRTRTEPFRT
ncbi:hypothetical protein BD309DRAFT_949375 [Dichomitus squalens]|nr:hypothetical protein BD309DRAFT_949375 [Dichomitus squalens]